MQRTGTRDIASSASQQAGPDGLARQAIWVSLLVLLLLSGFAHGAQAAKLVRQTTLLTHPEAETVMLGAPGSRKTYYRADEGCPLVVRGPGVLDLYVRGHVAGAAADPETLAIRVTGFGRYGDQTWSAVLTPSKVSTFGGSRSGLPTDSKKISLAVPAGLQQLILTATSRSGNPTYVRALHEGPALNSGTSRRVRPRPFGDLSYNSSLNVGTPGKRKTYYFFDRGFPLVLQGPGYLEMYVRGHVDGEDSAPESIRVVLESRDGTFLHEWTAELEMSSSLTFSAGVPGYPTDAKKLTLALPAGRQEYRLTGISASGRPTYLRAFYTGPRLKVLKKPRWRLITTASLESIYDDNICRYSYESLKAFRNGTDPDRYAITTEDDLIVNTALSFELRRPLLFGKDTRLRGRYQRWTYARNAIKDNDEIQLRFRQTFRRYDWFEAFYTYAPDSYIKELRDREPYISRAVPLQFLPFTITRNAFSWGYRARINSWLSTKLYVDRILRFYNRPFMENDLWEWSFMTETDIRYRRFTFRLRYGYADVKARGFDQVGETLETSDNDGDGSYENDSYRVRVTYSPKRFPYYPADDTPPGLWAFLKLASYVDQGLIAIRTKTIYFQYDYQRRFNTSQRPLYLDPLHVGRKDVQYQPRLVWSSDAVWRGVSLSAGIRYTDRQASAPATVIGQDDPSEEKDFTGTRYWLSFTRSW
jgi:hypothetical protein